VIDPHPNSEELAFLGATELLERYAVGHLSTHTVVNVLLDRIEALDAPNTHVALSSVAAVAKDALEVAERRDAERAAGTLRGPLHGVPVLIKDNIEARGLPGISGATALIGRPAHDAELVKRLRDAGAIIIGSTNMSQWANLRSNKSASGYSAAGGLVGNPWATDRSAGGSSSGSGAAVAAGFAPLAVGTETDGSITCPASLNGVVGLKATVGTISRQGIVPISLRQDSPGPMARSVADAALLYGVLSGTEAPAAPRHPRVIHATTWRTGHIATDNLFRDFLEAARVSMPIASGEFAVPSRQETSDEQYALLCEFYDDLREYLEHRPGDGVRSVEDIIDFENEHGAVEHRYSGHEHFLAAKATGGRASDTYQARMERMTNWAVNECLEPGLGEHDIIIAPAYAPAWKSDLVLGDPAVWFNIGISVSAMAGWPIATIPFGLLHGLPVGLTLIGRPHSEWALLEVAATLETVAQAHGWRGRPQFRQHRG
jgi:amidase